MISYLFKVIILYFLDLHGYIVKFNQDQSKAGNTYIDVTLRTADHDYTTIRIMRNNNPNVTIAYLDELKNGSNYITFCQLISFERSILF